METFELSVPKLAAIAATRGMAGFGAGLLIADLLSEAQRKRIGWSLFAIGALSTIPIARSVFARGRK